MPVADRISLGPESQRSPRISRDHTVSTKLTAAEYTEIQRLAESRGQWLSEWVRDIVLAAVREQRTPQNRAAFIELQAMRLLLINTLEPLLRGDKMTAEQFKAMLQHVKANKRKVAEEVLASYAERSTDQP